MTLIPLKSGIVLEPYKEPSYVFVEGICLVIQGYLDSAVPFVILVFAGGPPRY